MPPSSPCPYYSSILFCGPKEPLLCTGVLRALDPPEQNTENIEIKIKKNNNFQQIVVKYLLEGGNPYCL